MANVKISQLPNASLPMSGAELVPVVQSGITEKATVADFTTALAGYVPSGTGAVARSVASSLGDVVSVKDFGAVGDGTTDDTAAVQAAVTYAVANRKNLYFPSGFFKLTSTVTISGIFSIYGEGINSVVYTTDTTIPTFTIDINTTTVYGSSMTNLAFSGPVSTDVRSCAMRFIGDNLSYLQHCNFSSLRSDGFYSFVKVEKTPQTTGFGLESMLAWFIWSDIHVVNVYMYGFWLTTGSGTGNSWSNCQIGTAAAGSAAWFFDGSGCVVGDVLIDSAHLLCYDTVTGSSGIRIGASTVYRAQWSVIGCQFDANVNLPLDLSLTGSIAYTNFNFVGNNLGGPTDTGTAMQPSNCSVIIDRDVTRWEAGNYFANSLTGVQAVDSFYIDFGTAGSALCTLETHGVIGGVQGTSCRYEFFLRTDGATLEIAPWDSFTGSNTGFVWTCASVSATQAKFTVTYTPSAGGTAVSNNIQARGRQFKITRI